MKILNLLLLASFLLPLRSYAITYYSIHDTLNVFALSGLRLRETPGGTILGTIPYGSKIIMQEKQPYDRRDTIENIPGHWAKAEWQGKPGYVFDGFLSALPVPDTRLNTLEEYCERYFERRMRTYIPDNMEDERLSIKYYTYTYWLMELESSQSAEDAEAWGRTSTLTFTNRGRIMTPEELYLLMRALFRRDIDLCLEKIKTGDHTINAFNEPVDENYFQFVRGDNSGSYEFPGDLYMSLDYGLCIHGAYIRSGEAD